MVTTTKVNSNSILFLDDKNIVCARHNLRTKTLTVIDKEKFHRTAVINTAIDLDELEIKEVIYT